MSSLCAVMGSRACRRQWKPPGLIPWCRPSVVHLIRAANRWVAYGDRKAVSAQLRKIYTAPTEETARVALEEFEALRTGSEVPTVGEGMAGCLGSVHPIFAVPADGKTR